MPIHNVGDPAGPDQWFKDLPVVTRYWFGATLGTTLAANFQIISPVQLLFSWRIIKEKFELWRMLTCFCYAGPFDFSTLIAVYMLVQFSRQYEAGGPFNTGAGGGTADYLFMIIFGAAAMLISYPLIGSIISLPPIFTRNMIFYVLYVWSKRHPTQQANIWGVPMPAVYLPFAYLALSVFMGNQYTDMLHGLMVGHLYYFLADVVPQVQGRDVLITPQFLIDRLGIGEYQPPAAAQNAPAAGMGAQQQAANARGIGGGHNWGQGGYRLGRD